MFARINTTAKLSKVLQYNNQKVAQHKARLIHSGNFLQRTNDLTNAEKLHRFQYLHELNTRSRVNTLHVTLNFHPDEKLSDVKLSAIADRYMEGLQMKNQPYLVYRHEDTAHPHVHIVSSLIRPDGKRVNTHLMAIRLSEPTRKVIEQEFHLIPAEEKSRPQQNVNPELPAEVKKITPASGVPITQAMQNVISMTHRDYAFASLDEYNAILRLYNIVAETGGPGSKTRQHHGLFYTALDDQGNKISPPVMASRLPSRPTLPRVEEKFQRSKDQRDNILSSIRQRIDWCLLQQPDNPRELVIALRAEGIEVIQPARNQGGTHDYIFVDQETKTAVTGQALGHAYTTEAFQRTLVKECGQEPGKTLHESLSQAGYKPQTASIHFSTRIPQVLSTILSKGGRDKDDYQQDQNLGQRLKH